MPSLSNDMWLKSAFHNFEWDQPLLFEYTYNSSKKKVRYEPIITSPNNEDQYKNPSVYTKSVEGYNILYWPDITKSPDKSKVKIRVKDKKFVLERPDTNLETHINSNLNIFYISSTAPLPSGENARRYSRLDLANNITGLLKTLKKLSPELESLHLLYPDDKPILYGGMAQGQKIPLFLTGQGLNRLLSILLVISEAKNGVVLLDELENGFHYSFMSSLWQAIANHAKVNNTQIIATTHSRELIAGAVEGIPEQLKNRLQYRRIEKGEGSDFKSVSYDPDSLKVTLDADLAIR